MLSAALAARWHVLVSPLLPAAAARETELARLAAAYEAPGRHYHSLQHLDNLFGVLDQHALHDAPVVHLAVWYHDAVYNALRGDNEAKSAEWALDFLQKTTLAPARQQRVADYIRRTQDHTQPPPAAADPDLLLFLDADLSILGAPEAAYWQYARQVRQEYRLVPELLYRPGRRKVLTKLLEAPVLYRTSALRDAFDAPARRNLAAELAAWEHGGLPE